MKTMMLMLALAFSFVGGCSGDGDTAQRVFEDMSANMREMSAILTSVTDEASAKAALPKIDAVRAKMRDCARRARVVPRPDAATEQTLNAAMLAVQREVMPVIVTAKQRLAAQPELMAIIAPALQGMENDL
jgi:chromosomal replication initiation ATPase DnaA